MVDHELLDVDGGGAGQVREEGRGFGRLRAALCLDRGRLQVGAFRSQSNDGLRVTSRHHARDVDLCYVVVLDR